ncbi:hypothetical protein GCM10027271_19580 [Saccharopolyspora gloriosae]|uniref:DUF3558 domain-containing protein n=1 Tax=Saccharopolyspora gloriosae TaxID=455344 RepID=A0A840N647_9PSEU|nr:hypothetical protein [Saccharopolyspora gloriosae]
MSKFVRSLVGATMGVALVGLSGCALNAGGDSGGDAQPTGPGAEGSIETFDPCKFFEPNELTGWGLPAQSEPFEGVSFEPGCTWAGGQMSLVLQKNVDETVESYETSGSWERYEKKTIGGRPAALANVPGGGSTGGCTVLVDAGGGVAIYSVSGKLTDSVDACAETEKIADQTASRLPA